MTKISIVIFLAFASPATAYLDPGSGSMFLQALLATLAAGAAFVGHYWRKIRGFFSRSKSDEGR